MLISICIPTFNRLNDLKQCIASVIAAASTLDDPIEILVSNNASPDATDEWLNGLDLNDQKIKFKYWTNEVNIGAIKNIKKLMEHASGEYLFFLTDDDLILPNAFVALKECISETNSDFIKFANITYMIKSKKSFYYGNKTNLSDKRNHYNFFNIEKYTHVLSGCAVKKSSSLLNALIQSSNVYPSIEMCALSAGSCIYVNEPVVFHKWENDLFWELDVNLSSIAAKRKHLMRDAQLALLNIPIKFLDRKGIRLLNESILRRYGYVEESLKEKFPLNRMQLIFIRIKIYPKYLIQNFFVNTKKLFLFITKPSK